MPRPEFVDEKRLLLATVGGARHHVVGILEGLSEEDLRRPVLPSGWSCLGLVHHLAVDVERFWFRAVLAGERVEVPSGDGGWRVPADMSAEAGLQLYRDEPSGQTHWPRRTHSRTGRHGGPYSSSPTCRCATFGVCSSE